MSAINENLIRQVFDEMVKHKPSLQKHLIPDEDEDEIDVRVLADLIIRNFPWPIGVELRRLFSGSMRSLDRLRLDQLFKTIERTVQFLSFVMIADLMEETLKKSIKIPDSFKTQFQKRITVLALGNYTWLIRSIGNIFNDSKTDLFIPELNEVLNKKFYDDLDFWVPERNEIGHYQINLTQEEIEKRCVEYGDKLTSLLQNLAIFVKYKLVTVREIKVVKPKHKDARFNHVIDLLNSTDSDFKSREEMHDIFSDSNAVLLMKDFKVPNEFLNLSPLIIDTHPEIIDSKEKFNIKKDIFMYTKYKGDKIMYLGTEVTEKCDLSNLSNYDALVEEFKEILSLFGQQLEPVSE